MNGEALRPLEPITRAPLVCPELGCGGTVVIRSAEKIAEVRKKEAPDQEVLQCNRCSKLLAPRAFLREELAQMWQEAKLPGVPPNASDQPSSEQLLFDLWRPGGMPHPPGAMDLSSADPECLVWRARVAWLQQHWLQHSHYAGCFAKKDTCKANFPMAPNNQSRATAFVAGVNGGGPQVVSGLAVAGNAVLDQVVSGLAVAGNAVLDLTAGDALGGGKRKGAKATARDRASKRHTKTPANAVAADHQTSSANQTHLLDVPAPQSICPEAADVLDLTGGASGDQEGDEDEDLEGSYGLQDGSDDDFVAAPDSSNPGDEALSNRLLTLSAMAWRLTRQGTLRSVMKQLPWPATWPRATNL